MKAFTVFFFSFEDCHCCLQAVEASRTCTLGFVLQLSICSRPKCVEKVEKAILHSCTGELPCIFTCCAPLGDKGGKVDRAPLRERGRVLISLFQALSP